MAEIKTPPRNLLRLAGVINSANREADDEAGALIDRVRKNQRRTLGLIAKGHQNESLREQMLSEAEKEQALAELAAAVGDNGSPLDDEVDEKVRAELQAAKSPLGGSGTSQDSQPRSVASPTAQAGNILADTGKAAQGSIAEVGQAAQGTFPGAV